MTKKINYYSILIATQLLLSFSKINAQTKTITGSTPEGIPLNSSEINADDSSRNERIENGRLQNENIRNENMQIADSTIISPENKNVEKTVRSNDSVDYKMDNRKPDTNADEKAKMSKTQKHPMTQPMDTTSKKKSSLDMHPVPNKTNSVKPVNSNTDKNKMYLVPDSTVKKRTIK